MLDALTEWVSLKFDYNEDLNAKIKLFNAIARERKTAGCAR